MAAFRLFSVGKDQILGNDVQLDVPNAMAHQSAWWINLGVINLLEATQTIQNDT